MIKTYVAFDLETTGLNLENDCIIEIGALKVHEGKVAERFIEFLKPETPISSMITNITGITNEMVAGARRTEYIIKDFVEFCDGYVLVGHNIMFDYKFTKKYAIQYGHTFEKEGIDTLKIARSVHKDLESKSLGALCDHYHIINSGAHRAYHDALATAKLYHMMAHYYEHKNPALFEPEQLIHKQKKVQPMTQKQREYLQVLLSHHKIVLEKDIDTLTRNEASKIIDRIISEHGHLSRR